MILKPVILLNVSIKSIVFFIIYTVAINLQDELPANIC